MASCGHALPNLPVVIAAFSANVRDVFVFFNKGIRRSNRGLIYGSISGPNNKDNIDKINQCKQH